MSFLHDIITIFVEHVLADVRGLVGQCKAEVCDLAKKVSKICTSMCILSMAILLMLGAAGMMLAALVVGLTPHLGVTWSLMIAAAAAILGGAILIKIACWLGK
ncbi:MAG: hypothetical protein EHM48_02845 [Planctomycetaceae bacterium]|nr:MAG: hypothetical protein EHM48_02845 [Planctomycetaceae bacterium]